MVEVNHSPPEYSGNRQFSQIREQIKTGVSPGRYRGGKWRQGADERSAGVKKKGNNGSCTRFKIESRICREGAKPKCDMVL